MTRIQRKIALVALVLTLAIPVGAQSAFKGQLHISRESFTIQGSLLRVQMRVSYNKSLLNRGETLTFTPVLKNDTAHQALSSVVITSKGKGGSGQLTRANIPVALHDDRKGVFFFDYDTTIPYDAWMRTASLYIESDERDRHGKGHVYEDCLFRVLRFGQSATSTTDAAVVTGDGRPDADSLGRWHPSRIMTDWIQIVPPEQIADGELKVSGTIPLDDSRHIGRMGTRDFNEEILHELKKALTPQLQVSGTMLKRIDIQGYGAPVGNYRQNEIRSNARALALKEYLLTARGKAPNSVSVSWVAEDWDSIQSLINGSDMRLREAALDIIRSVDVGAGREDQLRVLDSGELYARLQASVFPQVCRLTWEAEFTREGISTRSLAGRDVTLPGMYRAAMDFRKGSQEYNDLLDLAARLYPDYPEACINAAGVAMLRGDLDRAAYYLTGLDTDPRAFNNYGVYHLMRGETAKAEVYLRMAAARNVPEAQTVLEALRHGTR